MLLNITLKKIILCREMHRLWFQDFISISDWQRFQKSLVSPYLTQCPIMDVVDWEHMCQILPVFYPSICCLSNPADFVRTSSCPIRILSSIPWWKQILTWSALRFQGIQPNCTLKNMKKNQLQCVSCNLNDIQPFIDWLNQVLLRIGSTSAI